MPRKRTFSAHDYERSQGYIKQNYSWVNVQFSRVNPEEMALYEHIAQQSESKAAYIKRLIREDMERKK